jgi:hypothetical protein
MFFQIPLIYTNPELLDHILRMWNLDGYFKVEGQHLELTLLDIYFLMGFPMRGEVVELNMTLRGWGSL